MYKIGFVILHYLTIRDTMECISSIQKYVSADNCDIVVVDNCSPNKTGFELSKKYEDATNIHVIINNKNLGFSKGNNIGIVFARKELHCDFIVVLNNDTYLLQEDFEDIIFTEYEASHFAVMGPRVFDPDKYNASNPGGCNLPTLADCNDGIRYWTREYIKSMLKLPVKRAIPGRVMDSEIIEKSKHRLEDCRLHGCCLIFSPQYFDCFEGFLERTFMYAEESILFINLRRLNLKSVYEPNLKIYHKEAVVSKQVFNGNRSPKKCWLMLRASIALKREMKKYLGGKNV